MPRHSDVKVFLKGSLNQSYEEADGVLHLEDRSKLVIKELQRFLIEKGGIDGGEECSVKTDQLRVPHH